MQQSELRHTRSRVANVFFSPREHRLRAGWRLSLQAMLQIVLTLAVGCGALLLPRTFIAPLLDVTSTWGIAAAELAEARHGHVLRLAGAAHS